MKKAEEKEERKQTGEIAQQSQVAFGCHGWCSTTARKMPVKQRDSPASKLNARNEMTALFSPLANKDIYRWSITVEMDAL